MGKTTFAEEYLYLHARPYLSADAIAAELAPDDPTHERVAAGREFLRRMDQQLQTAKSFVVESTLSGHGFLRTLEKARDRGFEITIAFTFLDSVETCIARVQERVRKGGHDVPEADIRRRYSRSMTNFWQQYRPIADHWFLYYNSGDGFQHIALNSTDSM